MHTPLELYQRIQPLVKLGIFERDYVSGRMYWNNVVRSILELDDIYNNDLEEAHNFFKQPQLFSDLITRTINSKEFHTDTLEVLTNTGTEKWVRVRMQAEFNNGQRHRIFGTFEDVTEHVKMVSLLEEKEKRFTQAFDHAPIGMALVSLSGSWIKVNLSLCRLLGFTEKEFLQHTFQDFTHPDDLESDLTQLSDLLDGRIDSYSMEKRYFHADGHVIWALLNVSLIRDDNQKPLYFVSQIKDITERKRNTEIIKDQNSRLLNFAHIVSHNLRSHTGNMKMLTKMILAEHEPDERNHLIQMLSESSQNLLVTLEDLNEVVKVHENDQNNRKTINLHGAVKRVIDILLPSIVQVRASVQLDIPKELSIEFDPAYLESVIINLVTNSLKYKDSSRTLFINIQAKKFERKTVLQVNDNGQGLDLTLHGHKLFGMYKTFHRHPDARGMGLFIVKNQVEAMGGKIYAESQPGRGITFFIEFNHVV